MTDKLDRFIYKRHDKNDAPVNSEYCRYQVSDHTGFHFFQCSKRPKVEIDGLGFCTQHAKKIGRVLGSD